MLEITWGFFIYPTFHAGRSAVRTAAFHAGLATDRHYRGGAVSSVRKNHTGVSFITTSLKGWNCNSEGQRPGGDALEGVAKPMLP